MQSGTYSPQTLNTVTYTVYVDGVKRNFSSMNWGIDTPGGLPDNVVNAGTGMRSRTGSITWASDAQVVTSPFMPIGEGRWTPKVNSRVRILAEFNGVTFERFNGFLGKSTYSLIDDEVTTDIYDGLSQLLSGNVQIPPQMVAGTGMFLKSSWVAYQALEQVGLGTLPPFDETNTRFHQSFQSGTAPFAGVMKSVTSNGTDHTYGVDYGSGVLEDRPRYWDEPFLKRQGKDILLIFRMTSNPTEPVEVTLGIGTTDFFGDDIQVQREVTVRYTPTGSLVEVIQGGSVIASQVIQVEEVPFAAVRFGKEEIFIFSNRENLHNTSVPFLVGIPDDHEVVRLSINGKCTGVTVRYTWGLVASTRPIVHSIPVKPVHWQRSFTIESDRLYAVRGFDNVQAKHVIEEWGKSTLSSLWLDEFGEAHARARDRLKNQRAGGNDLVNERIFTGKWSEGRDGVRAGVTIKGDQPSIRQSNPRDNTAWEVTVYQPDSVIQHDRSGTYEMFLNVPAEQDWGVVDRSIERVTRAINFKNGSVVATVTASRNSSEEDGGDYDDDIVIRDFTKLSEEAYRIRYQVAVASNKTMYLKTPLTNTALHPAFRDKFMPMIRAKWMTTWAGFTVVTPSVDVLELRAKGMYELECGWWLSRNDADRLRQELEKEVTVPSLTFDGVDMLYNPTVQVGDLRTLTGTFTDEQGNASNAWRVKYLVTGYSENVDANHTPTWSVDMHAFELQDLRARNYKAIADAGQSYSELAPLTYDDVANKEF